MYPSDISTKIQEILKTNQNDTVTIPTKLLSDINNYITIQQDKEANEKKAWQEMTKYENIAFGRFLDDVDWEEPTDKDFHNLQRMCEEILNDDRKENLNNIDTSTLQTIVDSKSLNDVQENLDVLSDAVSICQENRLTPDALAIDNEMVFQYQITTGGPDYSIYFHVLDNEFMYAESVYHWGSKHCEDIIPDDIAKQLWNSIEPYIDIDTQEQNTKSKYSPAPYC